MELGSQGANHNRERRRLILQGGPKRAVTTVPSQTQFQKRFPCDKLRDALAAWDGTEIEIVKRPPGVTGFVVIARR